MPNGSWLQVEPDDSNLIVRVEIEGGGVLEAVVPRRSAAEALSAIGQAERLLGYLRRECPEALSGDDEISDTRRQTLRWLLTEAPQSDFRDETFDSDGWAMVTEALPEALSTALTVGSGS